MPSHNHSCPAFINFFPTDLSAMMNRGFTVSGAVVGGTHVILVSYYKQCEK